MDRCKLAKSLWDRLKNLYGNGPTTTGPVCASKNNNRTNTCADDEDRSVSNYNNDEEGNHLFMAHETPSEINTSKSDHVNQSCQKDVFGSDGEDEDDDEAQVDLERDFVSALDELKNVKK